MILMMMLSHLAPYPPSVYNMTMHLQNIYPMIDLAFASPLKEVDNYNIYGPIGFNASEIIGENSTNAIFPAFNYSLTGVDQPENKEVTTNSSFLPVPDLAFETGIQSQQTSTAKDANEMT